MKLVVAYDTLLEPETLLDLGTRSLARGGEAGLARALDRPRLLVLDAIARQAQRRDGVGRFKPFDAHAGTNGAGEHRARRQRRTAVDDVDLAETFHRTHAELCARQDARGDCVRLAEARRRHEATRLGEAIGEAEYVGHRRRDQCELGHAASFHVILR